MLKMLFIRPTTANYSLSLSFSHSVNKRTWWNGTHLLECRRIKNQKKRNNKKLHVKEHKINPNVMKRHKLTAKFTQQQKKKKKTRRNKQLSDSEYSGNVKPAGQHSVDASYVMSNNCAMLCAQGVSLLQLSKTNKFACFWIMSLLFIE